MKDEVKRILKLVQEGKLSAEDAAELIEAFDHADSEAQSSGSGETPPPPPPPPGTPQESGKDPFKTLVEEIEKLGKQAANSVNWHEFAKQAKDSAQKAAETIKGGFENVRKGGGFAFFGNYESKEVSLPLSVPEGKVLRIENPCGDIKIVGGYDIGKVDADAKFRGLAEDVRAKAAEYTLIIEESDSAVTIRQPDVTGLTVDLDIQLVGHSSVEIRSESGDIEVGQTNGGCRVNTKSGDVTLKGLNGQIEVHAYSGDLTVQDSTTPGLTAENKSGDIILRRVSGSANIRTASGDVEVRDCDMKSLAVDGVSGDVDVDLRSPITGAVSVRTVSGNALIAVPGGSDCRVGLKTLRGTVACAISLSDEARQDGQVTGKLGEGKGTLDVSAVTGDITLESHAAL